LKKKTNIYSAVEESIWYSHASPKYVIIPKMQLNELPIQVDYYV